MYRTALTAAMALLAAGAWAASFEAVIGGPAADRGVSVRPTTDGGYVAVGMTASEGEGGNDVYLVRTDAAGEIVWTRTYGGPGDDAGWIIDESEGGFVITGFTDNPGTGGFDCYHLTTDLEGKLLTAETYGGQADERCWAHTRTPDGGFLLVGETTASGRGGEDCLVVAVDPSGEPQWTRTYGGEQGDRCFAVSTDEKGYILAGQTFSEGEGDRDAWILAIDRTGELRWSRTFGGPQSDVAHAIAPASDGAFLVTGYTTSLAESPDDPYLIKIDSAGESVWARVLPIAGHTRTITGDVASDGGFCLTGFGVDREAGETYALLVKTDGEGRITWSRRLLPTTTGQSFGYTVRALPNGGCVVTGHTTERSAGDLDLFLAVVDDGAP